MSNDMNCSLDPKSICFIDSLGSGIDSLKDYLMERIF